MKSIILAGGSGTQLYPLTNGHIQAVITSLQKTDDLLPTININACEIKDIFNYFDSRRYSKS